MVGFSIVMLVFRGVMIASFLNQGLIWANFISSFLRLTWKVRESPLNSRKHSGFRNYSTYHYLNLPTLTIFRKWLQPSVGIQSLIRPSLYRSPVINLHGETWILKEWDVWITKDGLGKRCFLWHDEILCNVDVYSHILSIFFWISPAPLLEQKVPSKYFKCKSVQLSWVSF